MFNVLIDRIEFLILQAFFACVWPLTWLQCHPRLQDVFTWGTSYHEQEYKICYFGNYWFEWLQTDLCIKVHIGRLRCTDSLVARDDICFSYDLKEAVLEAIVPTLLKAVIWFMDEAPGDYCNKSRYIPQGLWDAYCAYARDRWEPVVSPIVTLDEVIERNGWEVLSVEITTDELFINHRMFNLAEWMRGKETNDIVQQRDWNPLLSTETIEKLRNLATIVAGTSVIVDDETEVLSME